MSSYTFTSESVTEGHPDKMADQISDAVLDAILAEDPMGRVACETLLTTGLVCVVGEISTSSYVDIPRIVRETVCATGYDREEYGFDGNTCGVLVSIGEQSPDIDAGVSRSAETRAGDPDELSRQGAGDQGMMFGFACDETPDLMPVPIWFAHMLARRLAEVRRANVLPYLRPDGKTQVSIRYEDGRPVELETVLVSTQHKPGIDHETLLIPDLEEHVVRPLLPLLPGAIACERHKILCNPTGVWELGGPRADAGLTGRKIIVDTYGGMARHGGGAFSGKDPSKVDRSGAYAARWVAKHVVAAGRGAAVRDPGRLRDRRRPTDLGHGRDLRHRGRRPGRIGEAVTELFDLRPAAIIRDLDLRRPIYRNTAAYGHFGRSEKEFTWEATPRRRRPAPGARPVATR